MWSSHRRIWRFLNLVNKDSCFNQCPNSSPKVPYSFLSFLIGIIHFTQGQFNFPLFLPTGLFRFEPSAKIFSKAFYTLISMLLMLFFMGCFNFLLLFHKHQLFLQMLTLSSLGIWYWCNSYHSGTSTSFSLLDIVAIRSLSLTITHKIRLIRIWVKRIIFEKICCGLVHYCRTIISIVHTISMGYLICKKFWSVLERIILYEHICWLIIGSISVITLSLRCFS